MFWNVLPSYPILQFSAVQLKGQGFRSFLTKLIKLELHEAFLESYVREDFKPGSQCGCIQAGLESV